MEEISESELPLMKEHPGIVTDRRRGRRVIMPFAVFL
jgi:hypothetical protein